jgi:Ca2+ transporting ATPase
MTGQGRAIVCAVGQNTLLARSRAPGDLKIEEQQTDLEKKLDKTAKQISKYAMLATAISVVSHLVFLLIMVLFSDKSLFSNNTLLSILNIGIIAVVLMIVAIPEGLPLAVSIAMALSISRLKKDEILIKNLESV